MTETSKVELQVGRTTPEGAFLGEIVRFSGEEVGSHTEHERGDRGTDYALYRCGEGYRVWLETWSHHRGEENQATLLPNDASPEPHAADPADQERPIAYSTYTESQARAEWPQLFAVIGDPNVWELD